MKLAGFYANVGGVANLFRPDIRMLAAECSRIRSMDWVFYIVVGAVLFVIIVIAMVARYFLMLRLEEAQRREEVEQEARETAEANSGL